MQRHDSTSMGRISPVRFLPAFVLVLAMSACTLDVASAEPAAALDDLFFGFPSMPGMVPNMMQRGTPFGQVQSRAACEPASTGPRHIVKQTDDQITITFDVAGFKEDEVTVSLESNILQIAGHHKCEHPDICMGRSFNRGFDLAGATVELAEIQAKRSVDEMMTITLPKVGRGSRAIPVKLAVHVEPAKVGVAGPAKVDNN